MVRVFAAVDIDGRLRNELARLQERLRASLSSRGGLKWVRPENIHITLKFLGSVNDDETGLLCRSAERAAASHKAFELSIESLGVFTAKKPRVLWVGTGQNTNSLIELHNSLETALALEGWPKDDRRFSGHLTLCRIRKPAAGRLLVKQIGDYRDFELPSVRVDSITVYRSELTSTGPVYTALGKYGLRT